MNLWEKHFNIKKPDFCNRTALCCKAAGIFKPWEKIQKAKNNQSIKDFYNIFEPYNSHKEFKDLFPEIYNSYVELLKERKENNLEDMFFYKCRFLSGHNHCQIYEDRPSLCREFPQNPRDFIPKECGYYQWSINCIKAHNNLKREHEKMKVLEYSDKKFFIVSPSLFWLKFLANYFR